MKNLILTTALAAMAASTAMAGDVHATVTCDFIDVLNPDRHDGVTTIPATFDIASFDDQFAHIHDSSLVGTSDLRVGEHLEDAYKYHGGTRAEPNEVAGFLSNIKKSEIDPAYTPGPLYDLELTYILPEYDTNGAKVSGVGLQTTLEFFYNVNETKDALDDFYILATNNFYGGPFSINKTFYTQIDCTIGS